jgi:hypothetical protein
MHGLVGYAVYQQGKLVISAQPPSISTYFAYMQYHIRMYHHSGYPNKQGYLAPYMEMKYYLPEFGQGPRPQGSKGTIQLLSFF